MNTSPLSFAEILVKIQNRKDERQHTQKNSDFSSENTKFSNENFDFLSEIPLKFSIDPQGSGPHWSQDSLWNSLPKNSPYLQSQKDSLKRQQEIQTRARKNHDLSPEQTHAFEFFISFGAVLNLNFSERELKKSYRKLCFLTHPDRQNGSSQAFIQLKNAYEKLLAVFSK